MSLFSSEPARCPELRHVRTRAVGVRLGGSRMLAIFDIMQYCEVDHATARELLDSQLRYLVERDLKRAMLNEQGAQAE